jgi:hypothetical protein
MSWRIGQTSLPDEIWGHCAVKIRGFAAILVTGGWSLVILMKNQIKELQCLVEAPGKISQLD